MSTRKACFLRNWIPGLITVILASFCAGQTTLPKTEGPAASGAPLLAVPKSHEEINQRRAIAAERLESLAPTTRPATDLSEDHPARALVDARRALFESWQTYLALLEEAAQLHKEVDALKSEKRVETVAQQIDAIQRTVREVATAPPPADDTVLQQLQGELAAAEAQQATLSELQSTRANQLATGFQQQRAALEAALEAVRREREDLQKSLEGTPTTAPADRERLELQRRQLTVQAAVTELNLQMLNLRVEKAGLLQKQDARVMEAVGELTGALQRRVAAASAARARTRLEELESLFQSELSPHAKAVARLELFVERVQVHYFRNAELREALRTEFPRRALDRLRDRVTASAALWREYAEPATFPLRLPAGNVDSATAAAAPDPLTHRSGKEVLELRRLAKAEQQALAADLAALEARLGDALDRLHELQTASERAQKRFSTLAERALAAAKGMADLTRLETRITALRSQLSEAIAGVLTEASELRNRLHQAAQLLSDHVAMLGRAEQMLYREALTRRETGLAGLDFAAIRAEWLGEPRPKERPIAGEVKALSLTAAELAETPPSPRAELIDRLDRVRRDLYAARPLWWAAALLLAAGAGAGWAARRFAHRGASRPLHRLIGPTEVDPQTGREISQYRDRIDLLLWQAARDSVVPLTFALALWTWAWVAELPARSLFPLSAVFGMIVGVYILLRIIRHLFDPDSRCRVMPCDDVVARHYRFWARALLILTVVTAPVFLLLSIFELAPATRALFREAWKLGVLLILLGFLVRRRSVQFRQEPPSARRIVLVNTVYPAVLAGTLLLLILEVVGYGALVEFVGASVLASAAVALVIFGVVEYICELLDAFVRRDMPVRPQHRVAPKAAEDGVPNAAQGALPKPGNYAARVLKSTLRLSGAVAVLVLVLLIWDLGAYLALVPWQKTVVAAVIVLAALLLDRVIVITLNALETAGRLPGSTGRMFRRWLRGLLTALVLLTLIALAGAPVDKLWAPLSALFAMVAIGFVAVWSLLSNILATLIILVWRPFNIGENIEVQPEGIKGCVVDINFMFTILKGEGDVRTNVPNSLFIQKFVRREKVSRRPARSLAEQLDADKAAG